MTKMPFAADCQRRENGVTAAGEGAGGPPAKNDNKSPIAHDCKRSDGQPIVHPPRALRNRRPIAADTVTGLAIGLSHFRHPLTNLLYKVKHVDGSTSERNARNIPYKSFDKPAAHIFKIGPKRRGARDRNGRLYDGVQAAASGGFVGNAAALNLGNDWHIAA